MFLLKHAFRGERGIRTPGPVTVNSFQDCRNRPLCHFSNKTQSFSDCECKYRTIFCFCKRFIAKYQTFFCPKTNSFAIRTFNYLKRSTIHLLIIFIHHSGRIKKRHHCIHAFNHDFIPVLPLFIIHRNYYIFQ